MDKKKTAVKSSFDRLASDLTKKERKDILDRINPADIEISLPSENEQKKKKQEEKKRPALNKKELVVQFKKEPFFRKFVVWMKSLFLNSTIEEIYNSAVVASIARRIEVLHPDLINFKQRSLGLSFYNELLDLKNAQEFFKSFIEMVDNDTGAFYYLYGKTIMPEFTEEVRSACDPFQYPFDKPLGQEVRNTLLARIDEKLSNIPLDKKEKITQFSQSFEWLRMFTKLPLGNMISKFTVGVDRRSCMFVQQRQDYSDFAKILNTNLSFNDEFVSSILLASSEVTDLWKCDIPEMSKEEIEQKLQVALAEISVINVCLRKLPVVDLGKVINENSLYFPDSFYPGENWLQKYRDEWRIVFDRRWRQWNKDYKKGELKKKQKIYFGIMDFQKFPYHPWKKFQDDFTFKYDLSIGFVNFFFKQEYQKYASILNVITLEGDFQIKENRHEFTDIIADFNDVMNKIDILVSQVALGGDFGAEFMRYEGSIKSKSNKEKMAAVYNELNEAAGYIIDTFMNASRKIEVLSRAMLGEHSTVLYGPLTNLNKIMGRDNREFRMSLERFSHIMKYVCEILAELSEIDSFKV